jgi:hypothetical protein
MAMIFRLIESSDVPEARVRLRRVTLLRLVDLVRAVAEGHGLEDHRRALAAAGRRN